MPPPPASQMPQVPIDGQLQLHQQSVQGDVQLPGVISDDEASSAVPETEVIVGPRFQRFQLASALVAARLAVVAQEDSLRQVGADSESTHQSDSPQVIGVSSVTSVVSCVAQWQQEAPRIPGSPQIDGNGIKRYGEHWGFSRRQCQQLLERLHHDPHWNPKTNMYEFVRDYVKPWTKGKGKGLALLWNESSPLEVNRMISHTWAEGVEEFLRQLIESTWDGDVVFICALAIYQVGDGAGPSIAEQIGNMPDQSPFGRVLSDIKRQAEQKPWLARCKRILQWTPSLFFLLAIALFLIYPGLVARLPIAGDGQCSGIELEYEPGSRNQTFDRCSLDGSVCGSYVQEPCTPETWVIFALACACTILAIATQLLQKTARSLGSMIVVPTEKEDLYRRLWCVYEIFFAAVHVGVYVRMASTLIRCGHGAAQDALCSNPQDKARINAEIGGYDRGFARVDEAVQQVKRQQTHIVVSEIVLVLLAGCIGAPAAFRLCGETLHFCAGGLLGNVLYCLTGSGMVVWVILPAHGLLSRKHALVVFILFPACAVAFALFVQRFSWGICGRDRVCQNTLVGWCFGTWTAASLQMLGFLLIYSVPASQQPWSRSFFLHRSFVSSTILGFAAFYHAIPLLGTGQGKFGELLPLPDRLVTTVALMLTAWLFCYYMPSMMLEYNVRIQDHDPEGEHERRAIHPTPNERLVYFWKRKYFQWVPMPDMPPELDATTAPQELLDKGLDNAVWQEWMEKLKSAKQVASRDPRMWMWTGVWLLFFSARTVLTIYVAMWPFLPFLLVPGCTLNRYYRELHKWQIDFNQVLTQVGSSVKAQTIKHGDSETSYLSFALTPKECDILGQEPIMAAGDCINKQFRGSPRDRGLLPCDWWRPV
mmetsp:Transcript_122655/g.392067  ORF Transcript_122655/g.392067 Transcript_122655/m.392067 type:complete len:876 (+) Transcript_122655:91-2718(+)